LISSAEDMKKRGPEGKEEKIENQQAEKRSRKV
jgi:hypothetical protein